MKETYLSRDFQETAAQCFSSQAILGAFYVCKNTKMILRDCALNRYMIKRIILIVQFCYTGGNEKW